MISNTPIHQTDSNTYPSSIPSREAIMQLIDDEGYTMNRERIANAMELHSSAQREGLRRRLRAMERDGQLLFKHRGYQLVASESLVTGTVSAHPEGFGFVSVDGLDADLFLAKNQMQHVFDGDLVQVLIDDESAHRQSNHKLIKIVERNTSSLVGVLKKEAAGYFLEPVNTKILQRIELDATGLKQADIDCFVEADIQHYPNYRQGTLAQVTRVLGHPDDAGVEIKVALRRFGIDDRWCDEQLNHSAQLGEHVSEADKAGREDLRQLPFVTIDGSSARDFDDAVYCEQHESGDWHLLVAIADVSHYVRPGDVLDSEAQQRATSIYFPGHVVPMLPESLSNGLCSLNPQVDRLALVCEITISEFGDVISSVFSEAVIHSHARLTYDQAYAIATAPHGKIARKAIAHNADLAPCIEDMYDLYRLLAQKRAQRGAIDFESTEYEYTFSPQRKITQMTPVVRNDAHKMIEEFMLCANVEAATFLQQHDIPALYRNHAEPIDKKLSILQTFLAHKGLELTGGDQPSAADYNQLLSDVAGRTDAMAIRTMLQRSQSKAQYSAQCSGHFGLAYQAYAHFTSPIRRYPDLLVHRAIRAHIQRDQQRSFVKRALYWATRKPRFPKATFPYSETEMTAQAAHCSQRSSRADEISREVDNWLKCQYMQQFCGQRFRATISGVTNFGCFVELDNISAEGLVHISNLGASDLVLDAEQQQLRNGQHCFSLGDRVDVVLRHVDMRQRKMDFVMH